MWAVTLVPCLPTITVAARRPRERSGKAKTKTKVETTQRSRNGSSSAVVVGFGKEKTEQVWRCVENCGACCKLEKDPAFATPEEIFEDPSDVELYRSMIGSDGWCIHFEKSTRKCSIYEDRPYFCRVNPDVFESLYGIEKKKFDKEACGCCRDTIKALYGSNSEELESFNRAVRGSDHVSGTISAHDAEEQ